MKNDNTADQRKSERQQILILQILQGFNKHNHIIKKTPWFYRPEDSWVQKLRLIYLVLKIPTLETTLETLS